MNKFHISFSEYRLYLSCNFKHFLTKMLDFKEEKNEFLIFGSALHAAIEEIILKNPNKITYEQMFKKHLEVEASGLMTSPYFVNTFTRQGVGILKELDFFERYKGWEVFGVEMEMYELLFQDEENEVFFKGIVDLILKKDDKYLILDWKSAMKPWDLKKKFNLTETSSNVWEYKDNDESEEKSFFGQVALYKHFLSTKYNILPENISTAFVALPRDPIAAQQYTIEISEEFSTFILNDIKRVASDIINVNPVLIAKIKHSGKGTKACQYCPFTKDKNVCNEEVFQTVDIK